MSRARDAREPTPAAEVVKGDETPREAPRTDREGIADDGSVGDGTHGRGRPAERRTLQRSASAREDDPQGAWLTKTAKATARQRHGGTGNPMSR